MRRVELGLLSLVALVLLLAGCAPRVTAGAGNFNAAFSERGVIWVSNGAAFIAPAPQFTPQRLNVPAAVADVAWHDGDAYVALPSAGWVQRVTGTGGVIQAGVAVKLSASRIYREDGSALTYDGAPENGLLGAPDAVVTGGDGQDYALQGGRLYRVGPNRVLVNGGAGGPYLVRTPSEVLVSPVPVAVTADFTYRLTNGTLQRLDATGSVRAELPHPPGLVGVAGDRVVTVTREGQTRVFRYDLTEVQR